MRWLRCWRMRPAPRACTLHGQRLWDMALPFRAQLPSLQVAEHDLLKQSEQVALVSAGVYVAPPPCNENKSLVGAVTS